MSKPKERNELEFLRSENRRLKAENRHLKKEVARSSKRAYQYEDLEEKLKDIEAVEEYTPEAEPGCPKCGQRIQKTELGARILVRCESCDYRETKRV